ncbi:MAG: hypothetical protein KGH60_02935 [Candidatus Micrarchaeota archaeon]|nr:hypothetical protein [Candidatus Micrarchaeota archaeon]
MALGFKFGGLNKSKEQIAETAKDPTLILQLTKDIKVYIDESAEDWFKRLSHNLSVSANNMNAIRITGPGRLMANTSMAYGMGGVSGVALQHLTSPGFNSGSKLGPSGGQKKGRPEMMANSFELTTNEVRAMLGLKKQVEGIYDHNYSENILRGAEKRDQEMLRTGAVLAPDRPDNLYSNVLMTRILHNPFPELEAKNFVSDVGILIGLALEGKKFKLRIATIESPIDMYDFKQVKGPSAKSMAKVIFGGSSKDLDSGYALKLRTGFKETANVSEFTVPFGDKDDKKNGVDIERITGNFVAHAQPMINESYARYFKPTEDKNKLALTDDVLKIIRA